MSASFKTILVIGATSGIGEAFTRRFHAIGKKVIATGRRQERLASLAKELPGLETYVMDNANLTTLPAHAKAITSNFPDINTVWVNGGIQYAFNFRDSPDETSDAKIQEEITVNATAPVILAHHFLPHLLNLGSETNFIITSSGLAFTPAPPFPVYCPTKAFIHHFMLCLRMQLKGTNVNVIELAPPYVATELDAARRSTLMQPMPLQTYTDEVFTVLDGNDARTLREVAVGSAKPRAEAWRAAMQPIYNSYGLTED